MSLTQVGSVDYQNLIAGDFPQMTSSEIVLTGNDLAIGTVVGKITASSKLVAVDSANSDGSENPYGVLAQKTDATTGDKTTVVWLTGEFNSERLIFGGSDTIATHKDALRLFSIFAVESVSKEVN